MLLAWRRRGSLLGAADLGTELGAVDLGAELGAPDLGAELGAVDLDAELATIPPWPVFFPRLHSFSFTLLGFSLPPHSPYHFNPHIGPWKLRINPYIFKSKVSSLSPPQFVRFD